MPNMVPHNFEHSDEPLMASFHDLVDQLSNGDQRRVEQASKLLASLGSSTAHDLAKILPTASNKMRFRIIMTLYAIKDKSVIPELIPYLQCESPTIQAVVAQFLGEFGDESAVGPLIGQLTNDASIHSLTWIIQALGKLRDKRAVAPLIQIMHNADTGSARYTAIEALGLIGDPSAINEIMKYVNDSDHHVYQRAQVALEQLHKNHGAYS